MMATDTLRIYVACLASYNNGVLYGEWIDVDETTTADDLQDAINAMLRGSKFPNVEVDCLKCGGVGSWDEESGHETQCPDCMGKGTVPSAEEWAIHDYDGPKGWGRGENPDLEKLCESARMISEHGEAWLAYCDLRGDDYATEAGFQDDYQGEWDSLKAYAENMIEDCYGDVLKGLPDILKYNIDFEGIAHDMQQGGDVSFIERDGTGYVFNNN